MRFGIAPGEWAYRRDVTVQSSKRIAPYGNSGVRGARPLSLKKRGRSEVVAQHGA